MCRYTDSNIDRMIEIQNRLSQEMDPVNRVSLPSINYIAGVDLAYWTREDAEYAVCCIVVIDFANRQVVETVAHMDRISCAYIPGCLAFREIPIFLQANQKLVHDIDIYVFDGNGYLHPRKMGIAAHAGILLHKPAIGVAKTYFKMEAADYTAPEHAAHSSTDIRVNGEVYGKALRTHKDAKPVFVSIGNQIDLDTAEKVILSLVTEESRIPLPTRLADLETKKMRKQYRTAIEPNPTEDGDY